MCVPTCQVEFVLRELSLFIIIIIIIIRLVIKLGRYPDIIEYRDIR